MSELKAYKMVNELYCTNCPSVIPAEVYFKSEADKVIAELKSDIADLRDDKKLTDTMLDERNAEIVELMAENERLRGESCKLTDGCLRLKQCRKEKAHLADKLRHSNRKRCLAMAKLAIKDDYLPWNMKWHNRWLELAEKFKEK